MKKKARTWQIDVWHLPEIGIGELKRGIAFAHTYPQHIHEEYQFCFIQAGGGELRYRGSHHPTPASSLFIVHPGEVHSNMTEDESGCSFYTTYLPIERMQAARNELLSPSRSLPFFKETVIYDARTIALCRVLFDNLVSSTSELERETYLLGFLIHLIEHFSSERPPARLLKQERQLMRRVRDYLIEHYADNIRLDQLAQMTGLSPHYVNRVFASVYGLPPHAYQTQVRIARARQLLQKGWPLSFVASYTGFADQSHFTRQFKKLFGFTPGLYCKERKNVQDIHMWVE